MLLIIGEPSRTAGLAVIHPVGLNLNAPPFYGVCVKPNIIKISVSIEDSILMEFEEKSILFIVTGYDSW